MRRLRSGGIVVGALTLIADTSLIVIAQTGELRAPSTGQDSLDRIAADLRDEYGSVRFHREELLEDRLNTLIVYGETSIGRIYRLQSAPLGVRPRSPFAKLPDMFVATSADGRRVYRLLGFDHAERAFNQLIADAPGQRFVAEPAAERRGEALR